MTIGYFIMKRSELISLVREVITELEEANVTNAGGATFTPGTGEQYAAVALPLVRKVFTKALKNIGYKNVKRKKRPYSTKLIDYLQNENNNSN
jgi:hypothetical protein